MLTLNEWKSKAVAEEKRYYKKLISEKAELPENNLAEEARLEYEIENFYELVPVKESIDLTETTQIENGLMEYFDFVPSAFGEEFDIEMEIDLSVMDPSVDLLNKIKQSLFAEDYELEIITEAEAANVVFTRGKGGIEKKKTCPPGTKLAGNKCLPQTGTEKAVNKKKGIVLKRAKRAQGMADKKKAAIKAKITKDRVASKSRNYSGT